MVIYIKEEPAMQISVLKTLDISNSHSATNPVRVLPICVSPPSVQIVKPRKPCELDGRIDRLFEIDTFRIG